MQFQSIIVADRIPDGYFLNFFSVLDMGNVSNRLVFTVVLIGTFLLF